MKRYKVATGTVTYAIKGRDLLRKKGFKATIERKSGENVQGCGYAIIFDGDKNTAIEILKNNGIKILDITQEN